MKKTEEGKNNEKDSWPLSNKHSTSVLDRNMTKDSNSKANSNAAAINLCKWKLMNG